MNISEMHQKLRVSFDGIDTFSAPELTPEALDILLNESQDDLINEIEKEGYESTQRQSDYLSPLVRSSVTSSFINGNKPFGKIATVPSDCRKILLERAEVSYPDCKKVTIISNTKHYIVVEGTITYAGNVYSKGEIFSGSNITKFSRNGEVREVKTKIVSVRPETRDRYNKVIVNPFKKPSLDEVIRLSYDIFQNEIIGDEFLIITKYFVDYYKHPVKMQFGTNYAPSSVGYGIDVNCELTEEAQNRIVEKTVVKIKKILMQQDYNIFKQEELYNKV